MPWRKAIFRGALARLDSSRQTWVFSARLIGTGDHLAAGNRFPGQVAAEKLMDFADQRVGRILKTTVQRREHTNTGRQREFKRVLRFILGADEFLHPSGAKRKAAHRGAAFP